MPNLRATAMAPHLSRGLACALLVLVPSHTHVEAVHSEAHRCCAADAGIRTGDDRDWHAMNVSAGNAP